MASNYNCHHPGVVSAHDVIANCHLIGQAHMPIHDVMIKNEPHDDDVTNHDVDDVINGDSVSSHDVIKADLGPVAKEVPTGRTVLGILTDLLQIFGKIKA